MQTRVVTLVLFFLIAGCAHSLRKPSRASSVERITLIVTSNLNEDLPQRERLAQPVGSFSSTLFLSDPEEVKAYPADEEAIYAYVILQMARDRHTLQWKWIDPAGHSYFLTDSIPVGNRNDLYRDITAYHKLNVRGEAAQQKPGQWQVQLVVGEPENDLPPLLIAKDFRIDPLPLIAEAPPLPVPLPLDPVIPTETVASPEPPGDESLPEVIPPPEIVPEPTPIVATPPPAAPPPVSITLFFKFAKAMLTTEAQEALTQQMDSFKTAKKVVITGYHDAMGDVSYNKLLALQRAQAAANFLMTHGIAQEAIQVENRSEFYFAPNDTRENRAKNRRVTVEAVNE